MKSNPELEAQIENYVSRDGYRPVKPKVIAKKLGVSADNLREFKRAIKSLIKQGRLTWGSKHLVMKSQEKKPQKAAVTGLFRMTTKGFGVVKTNPDTHEFGGVDVHIPSRSCLDATTGDKVRIKIIKKRPGRDIQFGGRVEEVLERRTHRFVGTYFEEFEWGYVQIDGKQFVEPVVVGDSGAKNCRQGDKVVIEMVRFPSAHTEGEGVVVEVLGPYGKPGVDTQLIMNQYGLEPEFPEKVLNDARKEAEHFDESISENRVDFTDEIVITIDPKDARDFDDAISLRRIENGHWLLGVHIADVSHFVRPNTALDDEAYRRGTSVYLPDRVVPMLPEIISNNLASLQPDRVRYAMSAFIEYTEDGAWIKTEVKKTAIKSTRRFTYEEVDDFLERPLAWRRKIDPQVFSLLERMHKLAMILKARRVRDGAIELHLPDVKVELDGKGKVAGARATVNTESHQIIEEFMLAANVAVANLFVKLELPFLRRVHAKPDLGKLDDLTDFVQGLGIQCDSLVSRFEIQRLVERVKALPQRQAVNFALLKSMSKAKYSPEEEGHYALGAQSYCHFTSPIRRYPDLVIHRMVGSLAEGTKPSVDKRTLARIGDDCSMSEENAERAERDLIKLKLLGFFADKIGMRLDAVITGVKRGGFFAQGTDLPVEGFVSVHSLPSDKYHFDPRAMALEGYRSDNTFRLGDTVSVRVSKVNMDLRDLDFEFEKAGRRGSIPKELAATRGKEKRGNRKKGHSKSKKQIRAGKPKKKSNAKSRKSSKRSR